MKFPLFNNQSSSHQLLSMFCTIIKKIEVDKIIAHFKTNQRGILAYPCGSGKSLMCFSATLSYRTVVILSPYKTYAEQNKKRTEEYSSFDPSTEFILICSGKNGMRDPIAIKQLMKGKKRVILSSTYDSVDVVNQVIANLRNYVVVVDEFHNLSPKELGVQPEPDGTKNQMHKLIKTANKILFVSATPKIYSMEGKDSAEFNKTMFGETIATMSLKDAIQNKYVTNYKIYIPSINENHSDLFESIKTEIGVDMIGNVIMAKCLFLMKGIQYNHARKIIIYCKTVEEIGEFRNAFTKLNEYYLLIMKQYTIVAETEEREEILQEFANDVDCVSLLFSVHVLDECIDIPSCDGIYLSYASTAQIRTIQRMFRCIRTNKNKPNKVGEIYAFCNSYSDILTMMDALKEHDVEFITKIRAMNYQLRTKEICESEKVKENTKLVVDNYTIGIIEYEYRTFDESLALTTAFMEEHKFKPIKSGDLPNEKSLAGWMTYTKTTIREKTISANKLAKWNAFVEKYKEYIDHNYTDWLNKINLMEQFILKNNRAPSTVSNDKDERDLIEWWRSQKEYYTTNEKIMKREMCRKIFEGLVQKYEKHLATGFKYWMVRYREADAFLQTCKRKSDAKKLDDACGLHSWMARQLRNYQLREGQFESHEKMKARLDANAKKKYRKLRIICAEDENNDNEDHSVEASKLFYKLCWKHKKHYKKLTHPKNRHLHWQFTDEELAIIQAS